jgi:hypothetical protein
MIRRRQVDAGGGRLTKDRTRAMQCVKCGRPLQLLDTVCPLCGHPVVRDASAGAVPGEQDLTVISSPPVDPFAPTVYGPPVGAEPGLAIPQPYEPDTSYPPKWVGGYVPLAPRPAVRERIRLGCLPAVAAISGLALVAVLMMGAFLASGVRLAGVNLPGSGARSGAQTPPKTLASPCPISAVSPTASQALTEEHLSTGIVNRDPNHIDLRPVGTTSTFAVGETIYVTYQFATNQAGTVRGEFCANDMSGENVATASQSVPSGYRDGRGEFHLLTPLTTANIGQGVVTLTWNGAVAAVLVYTVKGA